MYICIYIYIQFLNLLFNCCECRNSESLFQGVEQRDRSIPRVASCRRISGDTRTQTGAEFEQFFFFSMVGAEGHPTTKNLLQYPWVDN